MAYAKLYLQDKWFAAINPVNPKASTATLTFTDAVIAAETVTINGTVFEFVAAKTDVTDEDNIPVVVGTTLTGKNAVEKLATAINNSLNFVVATAGVDDNEKDVCIIAYYKVGTEGNVVTVATTCTNASFGVDVAKLNGGQFGTPCPIANTIVYVAPYYYWCEVAGNKDNVVWKRFTPTTY